MLHRFTIIKIVFLTSFTRLHCLSNNDSDNDIPISPSRNNSLKSFTDEQEEQEENQTIDEEHEASTATARDETQLSPKTPLKINNTSTPLISFSESKSMLSKNATYGETPIKQHRLELSHSTVTSYTPKPVKSTTFSNKTLTANTSKSIYTTPNNTAFKTFEQNDTIGISSASFAAVKPPSTPATNNRKNISVHLIDLTTPEQFHTPIGSTASASTGGQSRSLFKSAIKNSAQLTAGCTPKRPAALSSVAKVNIIHTSTSTGERGREKRVPDAATSLSLKRSMTTRKILGTPVAKTAITPQMDKKIIVARSAIGSRSAVSTPQSNAKKIPSASTPFPKWSTKFNLLSANKNASKNGKYVYIL